MPSRIVITSKRDPKVTLEYSSPKSSVSFADLKASSFLDADSPHKWLYDVYAFSDAPEIGFSKIADADTFTFADSETISFAKPTADTFGFSESVLTQITFFRTFTDAFGLDDITAVDAIIKDVASAKTNLFGFSDDQAIGVGKGLTDLFTVSESIDSFGVGKGLTDAFNLSESLSRVVIYSRAFDESQGFADVVETTEVGKGIADTQAMTEAHATATSLAKSDSFSMAEAASSLFGKPFTEAIPISETLDRVVTYNRAFTDAISMDDAATVNALVKDHANSKTNIFSFSEVQAFDFSKTLPTDTFSFSDDEDLLFGKGLSDSVSVTENFSFALFSNAAMNAAQLNLSPFNE